MALSTTRLLTYFLVRGRSGRRSRTEGLRGVVSRGSPQICELAADVQEVGVFQIDCRSGELVDSLIVPTVMPLVFLHHESAIPTMRRPMGRVDGSGRLHSSIFTLISESN
jgi:hypothetical protein